MPGPFRWAGLLLAFAGLAACDEPVGTGAACLPEPARAYLAGADVPGQPVAPAPNTPVAVYVDGSGSMVGYLRASASGDRRPFQDFLAKLPSAAATGARPAALELRLFGSQLRSVAAGDLDRLVREETYRCAPGAADCDNQESRLDVALTDVSRRPADSVSIVVSDLWLSGSALAASAQAAVGAPLAAMLREGRAVGVLGVRAPYQGPVYDLPSGGTYAGARERPLYVLIIGPTDRVEAVRRWYDRDGTAGFGEGEARFSLFTLDPSRPAQAETPDRLQASGPALRPQPFLPGQAGIGLQQIVINSDLAIRERLAAGRPPSQISYTADPERLIRDHAVWSGPAAGVTRTWRLAKSSPCARGAWVPGGEVRGAWGGVGGRSFSLTAADATAALPKGGDYLLVGEVQRSGLQSPNPANGWMREWSFNAADERAVVAAAPAFFPTLNLAETARQMETALAEAAADRPVKLGGFAAVVRVKD